MPGRLNRERHRALARADYLTAVGLEDDERVDHGGYRPEVGQCDRDNAGVRGIDPAGQHTSNRDSDQQAERGAHAHRPVRLRAHALTLVLNDKAATVTKNGCRVAAKDCCSHRV